MKRNCGLALGMMMLSAMVVSATASAATDLQQKMGNPENWAAQAGGHRDLAKYTTLGGTLFVFALPEARKASAQVTSAALH